MPPDVTTGRSGVATGAVWVEDLLEAGADAPSPEVDRRTVEGGPDVVSADDPGCSLATTTPTSAVAPADASTTARVTSRSRRSASWRDFGERVSVGR